MTGKFPDKKSTHPKRRWSQNFLQDANLAQKIVNSLSLPEPAAVIEIGPGKGVLTRFLVQKVNQVLAVEVDADLARALPGVLNFPSNLQVVQSDFLQLNLPQFVEPFSGHSRGIIGNLPYHITSPIIFKILDNYTLFRQAVVMVQKEVAERIASAPGSKIYGILSVLCQFYARVEYLFSVSAHLFYPRPRVDSAVLRLTFFPEAEKRVADPRLFRDVVKQSFARRRKMLRNTLANLFSSDILAKLDFDFSRRPETLSVEEFIYLTDQISRVVKRDIV